MSSYSAAPSSAKTTAPQVTVPAVRAAKNKNRLTMLTAYDYPTARLLDDSGIDMILVGDSLGTVIYGEPNTLSVTMEQMLMHTRAVTRAVSRALVVADMPFLSYQVSTSQAVENAGRFLKEAGAKAVKLEGGVEMAETIRCLTRAGIPVMAHIGLTPQTIHAMGSYRMHGKSLDEQTYLIDSATAVEAAGAFSVVLECVVPELARAITSQLSIPTIGIGSGNDCDGQVLVIHDLLGLTPGRVPRFVQPEADLKTEVSLAISRFIARTKLDSKSTSNSQQDQPHAPGS